MDMQVETARAALMSGARLRIVVGTDPDDPTLVVWLEDGMVMSESVAGWSAGVVEPVCALSSDYLAGYLSDCATVEIVAPTKSEG